MLVVFAAMALLPVLAFFICRGTQTPYIVLGTLWLLFWGVAVACYFALRASLDEIASNKFGLCTGFDCNAAAGEPPLTNWLHHQIQAAAGRKDEAKPLTVGDLWSAPVYPGETLMTERTISLEVVTTGLTQGRRFTIPFKTNMFFFDEDEFRGLLPKPVVDWLVSKQRPVEDERHPLVNTTTGKRLCRLPLAKDTPVLLAARMSLSFPILLSAIPLYAVDYTLNKNQVPKEKTVVADRCWFSDGGISSNFPIQFFDSPLPRWPTFGIDLKAPHPDDCTKESDFV